MTHRASCVALVMLTACASAPRPRPRPPELSAPPPSEWTSPDGVRHIAAQYDPVRGKYWFFSVKCTTSTELPDGAEWTRTLRCGCRERNVTACENVAGLTTLPAAERLAAADLACENSRGDSCARAAELSLDTPSLRKSGSHTRDLWRLDRACALGVKGACVLADYERKLAALDVTSLSASCDGGDDAACQYTALLAISGVKLPEHFDAEKHFKRLCDAGVGDGGCFALAKLERDRGAAPSALARFEALCGKSYQVACFEAGTLLLIGARSLPPRPVRATELLHVACTAGERRACHALRGCDASGRSCWLAQPPQRSQRAAAPEMIAAFLRGGSTISFKLGETKVIATATAPGLVGILTRITFTEAPLAAEQRRQAFDVIAQELYSVKGKDLDKLYRDDGFLEDAREALVAGGDSVDVDLPQFPQWRR